MATFNEKKTCSQRMENFGRFVWNPDTGELLGRTLIKWVYISLYYVAFYVVIIGLFALSIFSLMKSLNPYVPDYQDRLSSPGVTIRPFHYVEEDINICINTSNSESWGSYTKSLQEFLAVSVLGSVFVSSAARGRRGSAPGHQGQAMGNCFLCGTLNVVPGFAVSIFRRCTYNSTVQAVQNVNCTSHDNIKALLSTPGSKTMRACQFTTELLGECSGEEDKNYGFQDGKPCFVIKMNRIIGFVPGNTTAPYVNCTSKNSAALGQVKYFPNGGNFSFDYFPYYGKKAQPNYTNPLVAVKFVDVQRNVKIPVVCKIVGTKISTDNPHDPYEGKVEFTLEIQ
ncbi:potassium-transporting ATPase subunit beta [Pleurodeles waltl]|uniref:potassium-transporting ATPase subunit beta n=1 Tax=Pleurodeles waltl TaxID=8319 RepID=UPI0037093C18